MFRRSIACAAAVAALAAVAPTGSAEAASTPRLVSTVVSHDCENLGVTISLTPSQKRRAQALLPAGFRLADAATLLVETSTCAGATVNGQVIHSFKLSEAALSVVPPRRVEPRQLPDLVTENVFMLSQLDTNRLLSETKSRAGYRTEIAEISLDRGSNSAVPRIMTASAGGSLAPSSARARTTPLLLPAGVEVPNPGVVYQLWTKDAAGRFVVTTNSNMRIGAPAVGAGTVTAEPGTLLHRLLGGRSASGVAFSGRASGFINDTYVFRR
ncbi:hypothetical protein [Gordonia sp. (in: high G+C Gram-positive bacteria)]|uniref:hypothetical protein n=1 Tax=Gordonia sp. (in: high G+C Gram-positive bacteria) TaxID=84139 RepID=UPI0033429101